MDSQPPRAHSASAQVERGSGFAGPSETEHTKWRGTQEAEEAGLLNLEGGASPRGGSNPPLSAMICTPKSGHGVRFSFVRISFENFRSKFRHRLHGEMGEETRN